MPLPEQPPLSLYIHFPWCVRKCPYCDFNSHEAPQNGFAEEDYLSALVRDLEFELGRIGECRVFSIFLGGGTPSLISPGGLDGLMALLGSRLNLDAGTEITLEANPGTAEADRFRDYRQSGINRLSIGIQSFDDARLQTLGRIHSAAEARRAVDMAHRAGFENINVDLMYGLPGQSAQEAREDLQTALACGATHISRYQLTLEPNTVFYRYPPVLPHEDECWIMQNEGDELLHSNGYPQYEISAYAMPGRRCLHNLNYWEFGDYLGIGAGAHAKITDATKGVINRYARRRSPARYVQSAGTSSIIAWERELTDRDLILEFMMNAMRLNDGVPMRLIQERMGMHPDTVESQFRQAEQRGLISRENSILMSTQLGRRYLNDLLQIFLDNPDYS